MSKPTLATEIHSHLKIGYVYKIDKKLVLIEDGAYIRNERLSNHWNGRIVNKDGTLGEKWAGYGPVEVQPVDCDVIKNINFN